MLLFNIERNEVCWCGSGKKYKLCHLDKDEAELMPLLNKGYPLPKRHLVLTPEQIEGIKKSSIITKSILDTVEKHVKEGISTLEINDIVHKLTLENNAIPAPLNYNGFPKSCCTSINDVICHGIPSKDDILKNGDILNIDLTSIVDGYFSDMSRMYKIGDVSKNASRLIDATKHCLEEGIKAIKPYAPVGNIGNAIHDVADSYGYSVVRALCGHGVGLKFHDEPNVAHYRTKAKTMILVPNMVFTVEPMINEGHYECYTLDDDWTVVTDDGKLSAQFEHTLLVTETGVEILTL